MLETLDAARTTGQAPEVPNLVGGKWRGSSVRSWIAVTDPASGEVVARVPDMSPAEVRAVWDAAATGAACWSATPEIARGEVLGRAAATIRESRETIARLITREMGKTLAEAAGETDRAADFFDYYAGLARERTGEVLPDARGHVMTWTRDEPVGLVLAITPWNDPLLTPARKLAPALLAGNAVVLKPAPETPISSLLLAGALDGAGLPAGALNTVTGSVARIGDELLGDTRIGAVSFTGSTAVGLELHRLFANRNVRLETEMGGKNASVVLPDADLPRAAAVIAAAAFNQTGQRCTATSRVIVHSAVRDKFVALLVREAAALRQGAGLDASSTLGPLISDARAASVRAVLARASDAGAQLLYAADNGAAERAGFIGPVILEVTPELAIWREELFGPVIALLTVDSFEAALAATNDSDYGLAAAIFTSDLGYAHRFIAGAQVGQVAVNLPTSGWDVHHPFGGWKGSGSPFKEHGKHGLRFYTRVKTVALAA